MKFATNRPIDIIVVTSSGAVTNTNAFYIFSAPPTMTNLAVDPIGGTTNTIFTFTAYYYDPEGNACDIANGYPKIITTVDGQLYSSEQMNFVSGNEYSYSMRLSESYHVSNYILVKALSGNQSIRRIPRTQTNLVVRVDSSVDMPSDFKVIDRDRDYITIQWAVNDVYAINQVIYWNTNSPSIAGKYVVLPVATNTYTITKLKFDTKYYVLIRTIDDIGNSADSKEYEVETLGYPDPSEGAFAYPNPAGRGEKIRFNSLRPGTSIKIYTIYGELIRELDKHIWAPSDDIASGVYIAVYEDVFGERKIVKFIYGVK